MMDLFSEEVRRHPYPLYDRIRSATPLLRHPQADFWMVFDYEGVNRALNDYDSFSSHAAPPNSGALDWLVFLDPPRHTKLRALISKAFTPSSIASLEPRIRELSRQLLDAHIERGTMDLATDYASPLPMMVIAEMLGVPIDDRPRFVRWNDAILGLIYTITGGQAGADAAHKAGEMGAETSAYLADLLAARRASTRADLLTRLAHAEVDGERLTDEDILGFFRLLLIAGSETTTNLINNAILSFIEHPDQLARVRSAPELLPSAIEEALRFRSPLQAIFRQTKREVTMHGRAIAAGKLVLAMVGSANRDPKQFPEPNRFDVTREPNAHVAFGHGFHFCLGAPLARLEGRIALADLLGRLKNIRLASSKPLTPRPAFHVHGPTHMPIQFEPGGRRGLCTVDE